MRIVFNGIIDKKTHGCSACGNHKTDREFRSSKTYILPSGVTKTFIAGRPVEVSDADGRFLLQYEYTAPNGERKSAFEVVE